MHSGGRGGGGVQLQAIGVTGHTGVQVGADAGQGWGGAGTAEIVGERCSGGSGWVHV